MSRWRAVGLAAVVAIALSAFLSVALAQEAERPGRGRFDPEQMRQRMAERLKETLGASDEEWAVIAPRLEKVQTLSFQSRTGGMGFMFGRVRGGRRFGGPAGQPGETRPEQSSEQSPVQKAAEELRTIVDSEGAGESDIKQKLTAYREAREEARKELAKAQEELREVLTLRQEAQLVLMGTLE